MAPKHRVIIDTDPVRSCPSLPCAINANYSQGVDDTLALLLALAANPKDLQVDLISVTYGNVEVER